METNVLPTVEDNISVVASLLKDCVVEPITIPAGGLLLVVGSLVKLGFLLVEGTVVASWEVLSLTNIWLVVEIPTVGFGVATK